MSADIVVSQFMSLDGVIDDPAGIEGTGLGPWSFQFDRGTDGDAYKLEETQGSDALLLGRKTYEGFAAAWPEREGPFADKFNSMPKYVVSTTLDEATWTNSSLIKDDIPGEVARLKEMLTGTILINGSRQLIHTLLKHDLIDEYHLMVFPIVLGHGTRLFEEGSARSVLRLTDTTPVGPDGIIVLTYRKAE